MIESIRIRDFRGIRTGKIEGFRKINLLVGPNNSGKSAVLEAVYLACTASRKAGLHIEDGSISYPATITDPDLLGDNAMQRILSKHNYGCNLEGLSEWEPGIFRITLEDKTTVLSKFDLSPEKRQVKAGESPIATFGLESPDRVELGEDERRMDEIMQRISRLTQDLTILEEAGKQKEDAEIEDVNKEIRSLEEDKGAIEKKQRERRESIRALADSLMGGQGLESFEQSRLIYCWHRGLSHFYKGDAAWIVEGEIPSAERTIIYDVSRIIGYLPVDVFQRNFNLRPGLLQRIAESFGEIFKGDDGRKEEFGIQFLPAPDNSNLLQGWIAPKDKPPVPIDGQGDGARSVFKLLVALHILIDSVDDENPGVVIWEEPELFQNPKTLGRLLSEITTLIERKPIQLFIASHSLESIAHFTSLASEKENVQEFLITFRLGLDEGVLSYSWFSYENLIAWLESGLDPRLWGDFKLPLQFTFQEVEA